jgi:hypothetical protein
MWFFFIFLNFKEKFLSSSQNKRFLALAQAGPWARYHLVPLQSRFFDANVKGRDQDAALTENKDIFYFSIPFLSFYLGCQNVFYFKYHWSLLIGLGFVCDPHLTSLLVLFSFLDLNSYFISILVFKE